MRAVAIGSVVLFHYPFFPPGWIGVDLFFVISGFLIGGTILDSVARGTFSFLRFYQHRALRILPLYYFALFLFASLRLSAGSVSASPAEFVPSLLLSQTTLEYFFAWRSAPQIPPPGSWSLVVEEHFYLLAPLALIASYKIWRLKGVVALCSLLIFAAPLVRNSLLHPFDGTDASPFFMSSLQFFSRYDELTWGVLAAAIVRLSPHQSPKVKAGLVALGFVAIGSFVIYLFSYPQYWQAPHTLTYEVVWFPSLLGASFAAITLAVHNRTVKSAAVVALARLSYPLYLFHFLGVYSWSLWPDNYVLLFATEVAGYHGASALLVLLSVALAYIVSLAVEFPFLRMYKPDLGKLEGPKVLIPEPTIQSGGQEQPENRVIVPATH